MFVVLTTCADQREANRIASLLLRAHLTGCVQMFPIRSIYSWKGKLERSREVALFIKTERRLFPMVETLIRRVSSYEVPCIEGWPIERVSRPFRDWLVGVLQGRS